MYETVWHNVVCLIALNVSSSSHFNIGDAVR